MSRSASGRACIRRCGPERFNSSAPRRSPRRSLQIRTCRAHSSGSSERTARRARASSPRLVSWVEVLSMACGQRSAALLVRGWNAGDGDAELVGIAADLVQRDEAVVAVEGGVLEPLGHHRAAVLLQLHRPAQHRLRGRSRCAASRPDRRSAARSESRTRSDRCRSRCGVLRQRPVEIAPIDRVRRVHRVHIGAIDRESRRSPPGWRGAGCCA